MLGAAGAAGTAFVLAGFWVLSPWLQPVNTAPRTIPNSVISVNILFMVALTFPISAQMASGALARAAAGSEPAGVSH